MAKKWQDVAAALHHGLGILYYSYHWFISVGISGAVAGAVFLPRHTLLLVPVSVFSGILLAAGVMGWISRNAKRLNFINPAIAVTKLVDTYRQIDSSHYTFAKTVTIRALHLGVDSFHNKFNWSGRGTRHISVEPSEECTVTVERIPDATWEMLCVHFLRPMVKGEEKTFSICFELHDEAGAARPYFVKFIDDLYPNGLTMRVLLPTQPKTCLREIFPSARAEVHSWFDPTPPLPDTTQIVWDVRPAVVGYRYKISWGF